MHGELLVGLAISLLNIGIHATFMTSVTSSVHRAKSLARSAHPRFRVALVMIAAVTVLMVAHYLEVGVWAVFYRVLDVIPNDDDAFYFAFVSYATLGYGDILPLRFWRLLGPIAAMNGALLFGWSTAVIYDVLRNVARVIPADGRRHEEDT